MTPELEALIEQDKEKQLIDIVNGEYFDEFLEDLPHMNDGSYAKLFQMWLEGNASANATNTAENLLREKYRQWAEARAYELATANMTPA